MFPFKVLLLTNFKHSPEDEESPVPERVRDTLGEFHNDILLHCGERFFCIFPSSGMKCFPMLLVLMLYLCCLLRYTYRGGGRRGGGGHLTEGKAPESGGKG